MSVLLILTSSFLDRACRQGVHGIVCVVFVKVIIMRKFLAIIVIASSSASGMLGQPTFEIYFGSSISSTASEKIDLRGVNGNGLNQNGTFGRNEISDDYSDSYSNSYSGNEEYLSNTEKLLEDSKEIIDIRRRSSIQEYYNGSKKRNSVQMHESPIWKNNIDESEIERRFAYIQEKNKDANVEQNIDANAFKNEDWSGIFDLSESSRINSRKESNKTAKIRSEVEEYQRLEKEKNKPGLYEKSTKNQEEIVESLRTREQNIRDEIDKLNFKLKDIGETSLKFFIEDADPKCHYELGKEKQKTLEELVYLQEALRISVKDIDTRNNSTDSLEKVFIPVTLDEESLRNLRSVNPKLKGVLDRLIPTSNPGLKKVIHLNSLEEFTLDCNVILDMVTFYSNKFGRIQLFLNCPNLRKLKVINYSESNETKQLVQNMLCSASNLEELDLSNNRLSDVDLHTLLHMGNWLSNVKKLSLQNNSISSIPIFLYKCTKLEDLNLENNEWNPSHINSPNFINIKPFLCSKIGLPNLKKLNIAGIANKDNLLGTNWSFSKALDEMILDRELLPCIWGISKESFFPAFNNRDKYIVKFKK